jgi:glycerol kinase
MMLVAGIDQGTTSTKALVLADDGSLLPLATRPHRQHYPRPGEVEHDAAELLANVRDAVEHAGRLGARMAGLANQGETVIAWDRGTGQPLGPAIVWQDQRTSATVARLAETGHGEEVRRRSGLPLDCYFSASKLGWLLDNIPEARTLARQRRLGLGTSDSYFIERLTGRYATDVTTAARTSLMNLETLAWDATLCDLFGVPVELLPEIADDDQPLGEVSTAAGKLTLAAGAVDQIAALYGHGCRRPGEGKVTVGTGAFVLVIAGFTPPATSDGMIATPGWQARSGRVYAVDGGVYTAAAAVEWLLRIGLLGSMAEIDELVGESAASHRLFFVPALAGLAFPHWDRSAAGLFIGIDAATTRADMIKAVLEGVAFRIAEVLLALGSAIGASQSPVSVDGGLMRSAYFAQFLADIVGRPLIDRSAIEVTALGMAGLAAVGATGSDAGDGLPHLSSIGAARLIEPRAVADIAGMIEGFAAARMRSAGWRR